MEWSAAYETGIESIDQQHIQLFFILKELSELLKTDANDFIQSNDIYPVYEKLSRYAVEHFEYEESLFEKHHYSKTAQHIIQHERFREMIQEIKIKVNHPLPVLDAIKLSNFLAHWLIEHILETDMDYVTLFYKCGVR